MCVCVKERWLCVCVGSEEDEKYGHFLFSLWHCLRKGICNIKYKYRRRRRNEWIKNEDCLFLFLFLPTTERERERGKPVRRRRRKCRTAWLLVVCVAILSWRMAAPRILEQTGKKKIRNRSSFFSSYYTTRYYSFCLSLSLFFHPPSFHLSPTVRTHSSRAYAYAFSQKNK